MYNYDSLKKLNFSPFNRWTNQIIHIQQINRMFLLCSEDVHWNVHFMCFNYMHFWDFDHVCAFGVYLTYGVYTYHFCLSQTLAPLHKNTTLGIQPILCLFHDWQSHMSPLVLYNMLHKVCQFIPLYLKLILLHISIISPDCSHGVSQLLHVAPPPTPLPLPSCTVLTIYKSYSCIM